jgi:hypothetical protein
MIHVKTTPGIRGKENGRGGKLMYDIVDTLEEPM